MITKCVSKSILMKNISCFLFFCLLTISTGLLAQSHLQSDREHSKKNRIDLEQAGIHVPSEEYAGSDTYSPSRNTLDSIPEMGLLLIPNSSDRNVMAFDPYSGDMVDEYFFPISSGSLSTPIHVLWNADQTAFLVSDQLQGLVQQFDTDGFFEHTFAPAGGGDPGIMDNIRGMFMQDDGSLLVTVADGPNAHAVASFDTDGHYTGNFIENQEGGMIGPWGIAYRKEFNDFLVSADGSDGIHRYDATGDFIDTFIPDLGFPQQMQVLVNGNILVANFAVDPPSGILEYTPEGELIAHYDVMEGTRGVFELGNGNLLITTAGGVHEISRDNELVETKIAVNARHIQHITPPGVDFHALKVEMEPAGAGTIGGAGYYPEGYTVSLSATPDIYHEFDSWTDADGSLISEDPSFEFEMVDEDITLTANFTPKETYNVTFYVMEDSEEEAPIVSAGISMEGFETFYTNQNGEASIDLPVGMFTSLTAEISKTNYVTEEITFNPQDSDTEVDVFLKDIIVPPPYVQVQTEGLKEGMALMTWNNPTTLAEFRYDNGMVDNQLGFTQGTVNSVMGAVHHNNALLQNITWLLTGDSDHDEVKIWILGLDEMGYPDKDNIIHTVENVPTDYDRWTLYEFEEPIETPEGFFMGISANGFLGLAVDDGTGDTWGFVPETQFGVADINDPNHDFQAIESWGFEQSFLLRAYGLDFGEVSFNKMTADKGKGSAPIQLPVEQVFHAGDPEVPTYNKNKEFSGYNVYLNDRVTPIVSNFDETEYIFTNLEAGEHTAGVQSIYTTGLSEIAARDFEIIDGIERYDVTFNVHMHYADFDPSADDVYITGDMFAWMEPGSADNFQKMTQTDHPLVYQVSVALEPGMYSYKYYLNEGFEGAEWPGEENRTFEVIDKDILIENVFGEMDDESLSADDILSSELRLFPNPANDRITIAADTEINKVAVIDMLGNTVYTTSVAGNSTEIDVGRFQTGIYFVQVYMSTGYSVRKLQITK